jgi:hypothetical protein
MTTSKPEHVHGMTEVCSNCGGCGFLCYDCSDPQPWNTTWCPDCNPEWSRRPDPIYLWERS